MVFVSLTICRCNLSEIYLYRHIFLYCHLPGSPKVFFCCICTCPNSALRFYLSYLVITVNIRRHNLPNWNAWMNIISYFWLVVLILRHWFFYTGGSRPSEPMATSSSTLRRCPSPRATSSPSPRPYPSSRLMVCGWRWPMPGTVWRMPTLWPRQLTRGSSGSTLSLSGSKRSSPIPRSGNSVLRIFCRLFAVAACTVPVWLWIRTNFLRIRI